MHEKIRLGRYLQTILTVGDFAVINLAYLLVCFIFDVSPMFRTRWVWLIINVAFVPSVLLYGDVHRTRILYADRLVLQAFKAIFVYGATITALFYILDVFNINLRSGIYFIGLAFFMLALWWLISHKLLRKARSMGLNFKRVIVVGANENTRILLNQIKDAGYGYRVMGIFDDNGTRLTGFTDYYTGPVDKIEPFVRANRIDLIFLTLNAAHREPLTTLMQVTDELGTELIYVPSFSETLRGQFVQGQVGGLPVMAHTVSPLTKQWNAALKRVFDLCMAVPVCLLSPLWLLPVSIGIKLSSPGPVFFKQKRTGMRGEEFTCYKFRTMRVNADADLCQATEHDPRKTRFGDFLRRTSIDELPQFFNVLIGNMSVVGPRPHMVSQTDDYRRIISKYMVRHAVKPGISGWAQVNGYRGGTQHLWQMERRVEYDVWYIHNWNLFLDIKIVFLTVLNAVRGDANAY